MNIEAMKLVREALEKENERGAIADTLWMPSGTETIFDFLDQAIEQAQKQEPVAYQDTAKPTELVAAEDWDNIDPQWHWMYRPLYTSPPQRQWVGLTDEDDIVGMARDAFAVRYCALPVSESRIKAFAESIEAKLKEKNT